VDSPVEFRILGPLEVIDDDGRALALGSTRERALLALLLLHRNEVLSTERIVDELWPDDPPQTAAKIVQVYISHLRKTLGPARELLETRPPGYVLRLPRGVTDVERCEQLVAAAVVEDAAAGRARLLREALGAWRGAPLSDLSDEPFAAHEVERLSEWRIGIVEDRIAADIEAGQERQLVSELAQLVRAHPVRERLRAQQMLALYRTGRQAEALEAFQEVRLTLSNDLGLEPGRELQDLQKLILRHDPALDSPLRHPEVQEGGRGALVGRERELGVLGAALEDSLRGRGQIVLVSGEPGIGKSALAEALVTQARARGIQVVVGRCWEAGGAPAYWPWVQSLRALVGGMDANVQRQQLGEDAPALRQLLPELGEIVPSLPQPPAPDSEGARFRLFEATSSLLRRVATHRPLVLVLDDMHAADEPSLLMLQYVAREIADRRILVLCAFRDVDPTPRDPLAFTLSQLAREPQAAHIALAGLTAPDIGKYISLATGNDLVSERVDEIFAETEGNPFFVGEIVRLLDAEGTIADRAAPLRIPAGVGAVIKRRLARLSDQCRELLVRAAVLGREFDLDALGQISGLRQYDVLDVLDEAMKERIVGDVRGSPGRFRFGHALIRDTLYDELTAARRLQLHREAAESLEIIYAAEIEPHLAELAYHFLEAAPVAGTRRALDYARRAGDRASAQLAFEEAVRLYSLALTLVDDGAERCRLLLAMGDTLARAGETPASKRTFREAADLAEREKRSDYLAQAALGYGGRIVWEVSRDDDFLIPLLERALAALGEGDSTPTVRLMARLAGGPLRNATFPPERRRQLAEKALAMARRVGDPGALAWALTGYISAHHSPDFTYEQVELSTEVIAIATASGDLERASEAYDNRGWALLELGDERGAQEDLAATARLAEELRQPSQDWFVSQARAHHALLEGRLADAETLIAESLALGQRAQRWNAVQSFRLQSYLLRRFQGRLAETEELVRRSVDEYPTYRIWRCVQAQSSAELGKHTEGRAMLESLAQTQFADLPFDEMWMVSIGFLAEAAASIDHAPTASILYDLLLPYEDRVAVATPEISTGSVARYLGLLAGTERRWAEAERHFERAIAVNRRIGAHPWLAYTQRDFANMLRLRANTHDAARASSLFHEAIANCRELGMERHAATASDPQVTERPSSHPADASD
jgi:DNA-binding SARP family transcriptional activator/tetratricopeptide (TPR) repeat protein